MRERLQYLRLPAVGIVLVCLCASLFIQRYPEWVARLFFGQKFEAIVPHLGSLSFGVAAFSLSCLGVHALIAWCGRLGLVPPMVAVLLGAALFSVRHDSLAGVVENQVWIYGSQLVSVWLCLAWGIYSDHGLTLFRNDPTESPHQMPKQVALPTIRPQNE